MQKNFLNIALECHRLGHEITVLCGKWEGDKPDFFNLELFEIKGISNHLRNKNLAEAYSEHIKQNNFDLVVGFNKMPGLDVYYAADGCFATKSAENHGYLYTLTPRYKHSIKFEEAVFAKNMKTQILMVSEKQIPNFISCYQTDKSRFHILPPGISPDLKRPANFNEIKKEFRKEFNIKDDDYVVLLVGSGFKTKGLDRAIKAMASLEKNLKERTHFLVVGQDKAGPFKGLIKSSGLEDRIRFMGGRKDVKRFYLSSDVLIHPAYHENTGNVLLEAMISGLPVLATEACGYAHFVKDAMAGSIIDEPFDQIKLNTKLAKMLTSEERSQWKERGVKFGQSSDIYSRAERAAKIIEDVANR